MITICSCGKQIKVVMKQMMIHDGEIHPNSIRFRAKSNILRKGALRNCSVRLILREIQPCDVRECCWDYFADTHQFSSITNAKNDSFFKAGFRRSVYFTHVCVAESWYRIIQPTHDVMRFYSNSYITEWMTFTLSKKSTNLEYLYSCMYAEFIILRR